MNKVVKRMIMVMMLLAGIIQHSSASHMIGAELGWTCVGKDSFLIRLNLYADCNGTPPAGTSNISFICTTTGVTITSLALTITSPVDVTPICQGSCSRCSDPICTFPYGIRKYSMQGLVNLSGAGVCCNIKMTFEQCCRQSAITTGAADQNFYTEAYFNKCQAPGSGSPQFSNNPIDILCVGQDYTFNSGSANSIPGSYDSVTYEWAEPLSAFNTPIPYIGSYGYDKPIYFWGFPNAALPFPRGVHLDFQTGDLQFRPMKAENTVMVIKVKIFRNQVLIGEVRREMCINVITCTNNNPPLITTPNNVRSKSVCAGETVEFEFSTSDPNPNDTVTIGWNKAIPGATWKDSNGLSKHPKATFSWAPNDAHVSSLPYTFTVTAKDNACPVEASYTQAYQITVKPKPLANLQVIDSGCGNYWFTAQRIIGSGPYYLWQSQAFTFSPNTGSIIHHVFQPGVYPYSMTMAASGCTTTYFDTLIVLSDSIGKVSLPSDTTICSGTSLIIRPNYFYGKHPIRYLWSTGDTNKILNTGPIYSDLNLEVTVTDSNGCTATDQMQITAIRHPEISSVPVTPLCYNIRSIPVQLSPDIKVFGSNNSVNSLSWYRVGDTLLLSAQPVFDTKIPGHYALIVTDKFGCQAMDTMQVKLTNKIDTTIVINNTILIASPGMKQYDWYRNDSLIISNQVNSLQVMQKGWYFAAITDSYDCVDSTRSVYVNITKIEGKPKSQVTIYPNPTKGIVILETANIESEEINISIFNTLGKQVLNRNENHRALSEIDLSSLPSGTYTIIIRFRNYTIHNFLVKE